MMQTPQNTNARCVDAGSTWHVRQRVAVVLAKKNGFDGSLLAHQLSLEERQHHAHGRRELFNSERRRPPRQSLSDRLGPGGSHHYATAIRVFDFCFF